ncbi:hypothetical protein OKA04_11625 [Luteolibacter flavescens]|uniref:Uncharacterized protein n=1 Tax=Luteolibacter flavescens TaxID=1859460 RepID=A0ABT3FP81_9BACT|nr:hypothetical protein [Luteolibacter flavescens]MCW1885380.1 hypothetical protein [Luteolibacter flavescens]
MRRFLASLFAAFAIQIAHSVPLDLINADKPADGWAFDNGREFPGATGKLDGKEGVLTLTGDFTGGGGYVQAQRAIDDVDVRVLSFDVRAVGSEEFTLRLGDGSGQCHQIVLKIDPAKGWQPVNLPLEAFFRDRGTAGALTNVARYESWGGAKDGKWHGPAKYVCFLLGNGGTNKVRTLEFRNLRIEQPPQAVAGEAVVESVALDEIIGGAHEWQFSEGAEFKGATGSLTAKDHLTLRGDFTKGGAYCAAIRSLDEFQAASLKAIRMEARTKNVTTVSVQLVDGSGQTHQRKGIPVVADGAWHEIVIDPQAIAGGEHWGGTNDGQWHEGAAKLFSISVTSGSDERGKQPALEMRRIRGEFLLPVFSGEAVLEEDFNDGLPAGWTSSGAVEAAALKLSRTVDETEKPQAFSTTIFTVVPGRWLAGMRVKSALESPDNSYHGSIVLDVFGPGGKRIATLPVSEITGKRDWETIRSTIDLPTGATAARIRGELRKTWGTLWLDDLAISPLEPAPLRAGRVERLLFSTAALGNLLLPGDPRTVTVEVICRKPLAADARSLAWTVCDYWGVEQQMPVTTSLDGPETKDGKFIYTASLDLSRVPLETGRYYEVHASLDGEHFKNHTGLAILPEAATHRHEPEDVPFTARNWDNRIPEFIRLSHRLGVRMCGVWGGWSAKPPYTPEAPGLDLVKELGMGWVTGTPAAQIERGSTDYDERALREGMRNFLTTYGKHRPLVINLGNEPHGTGERVVKNAEAYRVLYDEVKKFDPSIKVVATSVEPNEEYFKAGYGKSCDAFDFHIYESAEDVRRTIGEYRALQEKYGVEKPIWSTELGLNSQGMTRLAVASELPKKFATFFAAGGENASWFGLLYPDGDGSSHGSSGDSHNVFDCRYNRYNPRLDAVAYYHAVNAIAVKRFVEEKRYPDGTRAVLFRDAGQHALLVTWNDTKSRQVEWRLAGTRAMTHIAIDGRTTELKSPDGSYRLTVGAEPVMMLFDGDAKLPSALPDSPVQLTATAGEVKCSAGKNWQSRVKLIPPPRWTAQASQVTQDNLAWKMIPPAETTAREAEWIAGDAGSGTWISTRVPLK